MVSRGGGGLPTSRSADASGRGSSAFTRSRSTDAELCRRIGTGDSGRWEDVDGFGCSSSSSSPSASSVARCLPFPLLGVTEARVVCLSSVAPNDRAREIRLQGFLDEVAASGRTVALRVTSGDSLDLPTRLIMLRRRVDLRERFGRSDDATTASSRDGVEVIGNWADGPELEGELGAVEVFCFDVVCPISNRVSVGTDSIWLCCGGGPTRRGRWGREVKYGTNEERKLRLCRCRGWGKG